MLVAMRMEQQPSDGWPQRESAVCALNAGVAGSTGSAEADGRLHHAKLIVHLIHRLISPAALLSRSSMLSLPPSYASR